MSRIDDKSGDRRAQEARLQDRRNQERLQKQRTAESTAFDAALKRQKESSEKPDRQLKPKNFAQERQKANEKQPLDPKPATETAASVELLLEGELPDSQGQQLQHLKQKGQTFNERLTQRKPSQGAEAKVESQLLGRQQEAERATGERQPDAKSDDIRQDIVSGGGRRNAPVQRQGDQQGGGAGRDSGQSGGKEQKETSFKLPPTALMAPPPVARPKDGPGAAGLRAMTKEIVDKIVSRVLVGHNDQGVPEFRIDLKSDVLKGLSIKVSGGRGGKIRAVFSGTDREALKALEKSSSELVKALAAKGLSLEAIEFEQA